MPATTAQTLYGEIWGQPDPEFEAILAESLRPRGPDSLFDLFGTIQPGDLVLDIGCHEAGDSVELVRRFGCRVIGVDLIPGHIESARGTISAASFADRIAVQVGSMESIPLQPGSIDHIWCRDMLNHVPLHTGLVECGRVLKPGGKLLIYITVATPLLEPLESSRLIDALAIVPDTLSASKIEAAAAIAGFSVVRKEIIGSEWREAALEAANYGTDVVRILLRLSRMQRQEEMLVARFGRARYEAAYCGELWGFYILFGKLCPVVYLMRKR